MMSVSMKTCCIHENLQIAWTQEKDIEQIMAIEQASFTDPWTEGGFFDALKYSYSLMLCAKLGDTIVGYGCLYHIMEEGEIVHIAVAPDFRSMGIGLKLLESLLTHGRNLGVTRFLLDVRFSNASAIALYEKAGFKKLTVQKNFYENPVEDAWLMEL